MEKALRRGGGYMSHSSIISVGLHVPIFVPVTHSLTASKPGSLQLSFDKENEYTLAHT